MNILIIGNGFDIAHNLPTQYRQFLNMCSSVQKIAVKWEGDIPKVREGARNRKNVQLFCNHIGKKLYLDFKNMVHDNFWISHFKSRQQIIGDKWLNFEKEIKMVLQTANSECRDGDDIIIQVINKEIKDFCEHKGLLNGKHVFRELFDELLIEHEKLLRALEIYLDGYVNQISIKEIPYISNKKIDKVLSFNYTNTFSRCYDPSLTPCFVHGKADKQWKTTNCNLVLGFDDHYVKDTSIIPELIPFQKYYQRIVKSTDTNYYEWINDYPTTESDHIYFYGHSMDPEDGDILRRFILNNHTKITIYYYNDRDRAEKIKNLAIVLGPDNLIELTGGTAPKIRFESDNNSSD